MVIRYYHKWADFAKLLRAVLAKVNRVNMYIIMIYNYLCASNVQSFLPAVQEDTSKCICIRWHKA